VWCERFCGASHPQEKLNWLFPTTSLIFGKKRSWWSLGVVLSLAEGQVSFGHGVATRGMSSA